MPVADPRQRAIAADMLARFWPEVRRCTPCNRTRAAAIYSAQVGLGLFQL